MFITIVLCIVGFSLITLGIYLWYRRRLNDESSFGHDDVRWEQIDSAEQDLADDYKVKASHDDYTSNGINEKTASVADLTEESVSDFISDTQYDIDESLDQELDQLGKLLIESDEINDDHDAAKISSSSQGTINKEALNNASKLSGDPEMVVSVHVMAKSGLEFHGDQLLEAFEQVGLQHGDRDIFHFYDSENEGAPIRFSAANMLEPGTFDLSAMQDVRTKGVTLFMLLPGENNNVDTFENLLSTSEKMAKKLGGELRDNQRSVLTKQGTNLMKESIHQYYSRKKVIKARSADSGLKQGQLNF